MQIKPEDIIKQALELGVTNAAVVDVNNIEFSQEFRELCEKNTCRQYNMNWMCPPAVGPLEVLEKRVRQYKQGVLLQTVQKLRSCFDYPGMVEGEEKHTKIVRKLVDKLKAEYKDIDFLPLNVGPCTFCPKCTYPEGKPCRFPDKAMASVEAYGINVMSLTRKSDIPYYNGENTVSYVALILFN